MADHGIPTDNATVVGDIYAAWAEWTPAAPAVTAHSAYGPQRTITYRELDEQSALVAGNLVARGIERGQRVAFMMGNTAGIEGVLTYVGTHRAAAVALPINGRLTPSEVVPLAEHAEISALVVEAAFIAHAQAVLDSMSNPPLILVASPKPPEGMLNFDVLLDPTTAIPAAELPQVHPDDMADWLFTSGTTAAPKCVMLTHDNCVAAAHMLSRFPGTRHEDVMLTPFPFYTSSGVHTSLFTTAVAGAHYVMSIHTDAEPLLRDIAESKATIVGAVPSIFGYMAKHPAATEVDLSGVRIAWHGGAPVSPSQVASYQALFPRAEIMNVFGQTESGNPGTTLPGQFALAKAGSIGRTGKPGVRIRVIDDDGQDISFPGVGELLLKSRAVMVGYYRNPEETARTLRDGWLYTGDLVRVDDEGFMWVHDRKKDIIIRGGFNIASIEVENALTAHPAIHEAAVVSKPHPDLGEDLVAFLVSDGSAHPSTEEIRAHCSPLLADFKIPRDFRWIDALPRNPTGKVLKRELRGQV